MCRKNKIDYLLGHRQWNGMNYNNKGPIAIEKSEFSDSEVVCILINDIKQDGSQTKYVVEEPNDFFHKEMKTNDIR